MMRTPASILEDVHRGLPWPVGVGIRTVSEGEVPTLWPGEEELLGPKALERRRAYFALGRAAARDALAVLGIAPVALGRGTAGEPLWPAKFDAAALEETRKASGPREWAAVHPARAQPSTRARSTRAAARATSRR